MKIEKAQKVYVCCGKYYALTKAAADKTKTFTCPCCGAALAPIKVPYINIVKTS